MKSNSIASELLKESLQLLFSKHILFYGAFLFFFSCNKKEMRQDEIPKKLKLHRIIMESTYPDEAKVYANDSIFCIYFDDKYVKIWRNGVSSEKNNQDIIKLIKKNDIDKHLMFINICRSL